MEHLGSKRIYKKEEGSWGWTALFIQSRATHSTACVENTRTDVIDEVSLCLPYVCLHKTSVLGLPASLGTWKCFSYGGQAKFVDTPKQRWKLNGEFEIRDHQAPTRNIQANDLFLSVDRFLRNPIWVFGLSRWFVNFRG
ncbi:hypothetical protein Q3G72_007431 [Acer saccharum]|nr:hypothetical protein Q3G72_007431 [Acer saccharum]